MMRTNLFRSFLALSFLLVSFALLGCPPPPKGMEFRSGDKRVKKHRIEALDGQVQIAFTAGGYCINFPEYEVLTEFRIKYDNPDSNVVINFESLRVLLNGREMDWYWDNSAGSNEAKGKISNRSRFRIDLTDSDWSGDSSRVTLNAEFGFVFDRFLIHEGQFVPLDTVWAINPYNYCYRSSP